MQHSQRISFAAFGEISVQTNESYTFTIVLHLLQESKSSHWPRDSQFQVGFKFNLDFAFPSGFLKFQCTGFPISEAMLNLLDSGFQMTSTGFKSSSMDTSSTVTRFITRSILIGSLSDSYFAIRNVKIEPLK